MNCALAILLLSFFCGHDASCPYITILFTFWITIIIYYFNKNLKNPSFASKNYKINTIYFIYQFYTTEGSRISSPLLNLPISNLSSIEREVLPVNINSAINLLVTGANINPCPLNPIAT